MKTQIHHSNIHSSNEKEISLTRKVAERIFGRDFDVKLFQLCHHQEIKETDIMKKSRSELHGTCISCDNCNGVQCGLIYVPRNLIRITRNSKKKIKDV